MVTSPWLPDKTAIGSVIRRRRKLAHLSVRELAKLSKVSNAYLSQIERGLHEPSLRVLSSIAGALSVPVEELVLRIGGDDTAEDDDKPEDDGAQEAESAQVDVESAVRRDSRLMTAQQDALIAVYRSYLAAAGGKHQHD